MKTIQKYQAGSPLAPKKSININFNVLKPGVFAFPSLTNFAKNVKVIKANSSQAKENKMKQRVLIANGHTELKENGSWGPYQEKLWQAYIAGHPERERAVLDIAPTIVWGSEVGTPKAVTKFERPHGESSLPHDVTNYVSDAVTDSLNNKYYNMCMDTIAVRERDGFYDRNPNMRERDLWIASQYKTNSRPLWSCVRSVTGLYDRNTTPLFMSNITFQDQAPQVGFYASQIAQPTSIIQRLTPSGTPTHMVYNIGNGLIYNTHGFPIPFVDGSQLEPAAVNGVDYYDPNTNIFYFPR